MHEGLQPSGSRSRTEETGGTRTRLWHLARVIGGTEAPGPPCKFPRWAMEDFSINFIKDRVVRTKLASKGGTTGDHVGVVREGEGAGVLLRRVVPRNVV